MSEGAARLDGLASKNGAEFGRFHRHQRAGHRSHHGQEVCAFDAKTGEELWVAELEASAHATPVTYLGKKSGKQFVAIAVGGGGFFEGPLSDELAAYALSDR